MGAVASQYTETGTSVICVNITAASWMARQGNGNDPEVDRGVDCNLLWCWEKKSDDFQNLRHIGSFVIGHCWSTEDLSA